MKLPKDSNSLLVIDTELTEIYNLIHKEYKKPFKGNSVHYKKTDNFTKYATQYINKMGILLGRKKS